MLYLIDEELAKAVLSYLATRPYQETFQLIHLLQAMTPTPTPTQSETETELASKDQQ